uniref:Flagellar basal body-associated protein FliL n=1 Tax=Paracidobacterium acidisoli TaxID=2303751 RepID=A0A372ILZ7_9BACT
MLIVRHAEKPASGPSLTPEGFARAKKYAQYFNPFRADGAAIQIDALYAGADSSNSVRPRLTLEPLSRAIGIPLNTQFPTNEPAALVHALSTEPHGDHVLIAWRHGKIPALLKAFGADPSALLPGSVWPDSVFDWVILLRYDSAGHLQVQKVIHEPNPLP